MRARVPQPVDPVESARTVGLRYITGWEPGISRRRAGKGFVYLNWNGGVIRQPALLTKIRTLRIPPAWTSVWICADARGHLQAVGRDARNRKQYLYHQQYREFRDQTKFSRMVAFGEALPRIRKAVARDLRLPGLPKSKVLATVVRLLESTCMRIGNDQYARENQSYGLTTLRSKHVQVQGAKLEFKFKGKSGQFHDIQLNDQRLARIVKKMDDLPGYELFEYVTDDGAVSKISSADINCYLREITEDEFTAKDFRTWTSSALAILALEEIGPAATATQLKKNIIAAIKATAAKLGNKPAACRKYYIHPRVFESYAEGTLLAELANTPALHTSSGLRREEKVLLKLIKRSDRPQRHNSARGTLPDARAA